MQIDGWKYYNHAAIPQTPPHEMPDMRPVESGGVWKIAGGGTITSKMGYGFRLRL